MKNRRIFSSLLAAFLLATLFFSSAFVAHEADHDCDGYDIVNFQLLGSSAASSTSLLPETCHFVVETVPCVRYAPVTPLQSLDVRFDE